MIDPAPRADPIAVMSTTNEVALVAGTGAVTALASNAAASAAAVRAGVAAMRAHPYLIDRAGMPMIVAASPALPADLPHIERLVELAACAAREALDPLLQPGIAGPEVAIFLALPEYRPLLPSIEAPFARAFLATLPQEIRVEQLRCHPHGHAGAVPCIQHALQWMASGNGRLCLVGGVDSYLHPELLEWRDENELLHSATTIWGSCPGEAAGFLLLASPRDAAELGLACDIEIVSAASAQEPHPIRTEGVCIGEGLSDAMQDCLRSLSHAQRVSHTLCDMNGEPYRGNEYGFAVMRTAQYFADDAGFSTPADCWGDVGAASVPLLVMLATFAARKRYGRGPYDLVWASSDQGLRGAALLHNRNC